MNIWEALTTATGLSSKVIGSKRGRITEGEPANIVILDIIPNNVLDLNYMSTIILNGKIIKIDDLRQNLKKIPLFG